MLADRGFVSRQVKDACSSVGTVMISRRKNIRKRYKPIALVVTICALLAGYGVIVARQKSGFYLCEKVFVQVRPGLKKPLNNDLYLSIVSSLCLALSLFFYFLLVWG